MIKPDVAVKVRRGVPFDRSAALLIGSLAVLAAVLSFVQMAHNHAAGRAQSEGARLATDLATRIVASSQVFGFTAASQQDALGLGIAALGRALAGSTANLPDEVAVGQVDSDAAQHLQNEITAMTTTLGGPPLDAYASGLVNASVDEMQAELTQQQAQVDLASEEGRRARLAILGISLAALAGVMVGLAAVLKEGRPGWAVLLIGWGVAGLALMSGAFAAF